MIFNKEEMIKEMCRIKESNRVLGEKLQDCRGNKEHQTLGHKDILAKRDATILERNERIEYLESLLMAFATARNSDEDRDAIKAIFEEAISL